MSSPRDLALSLLSAANNHGDLDIKLSSLKQVKEILLASDPSFAADLFPYLADLHSSPEALVRNTLIQSVTLYFFFSLLNLHGFNFRFCVHKLVACWLILCIILFCCCGVFTGAKL